jgi:hypothetical protein
VKVSEVFNQLSTMF